LINRLETHPTLKTSKAKQPYYTQLCELISLSHKDSKTITLEDICSLNYTNVSLPAFSKTLQSALNITKRNIPYTFNLRNTSPFDPAPAEDEMLESGVDKFEQAMSKLDRDVVLGLVALEPKPDLFTRLRPRLKWDATTELTLPDTIEAYQQTTDTIALYDIQSDPWIIMTSVLKLQERTCSSSVNMWSLALNCFPTCLGILKYSEMPSSLAFPLKLVCMLVAIGTEYRSNTWLKLLSMTATDLINSYSVKSLDHSRCAMKKSKDGKAMWMWRQRDVGFAVELNAVFEITNGGWKVVNCTRPVTKYIDKVKAELFATPTAERLTQKQLDDMFDASAGEW
jgi:hypothetical protein